MNITVRTNNVPRDIIDAYQLTPQERKEFDYLNWDAIEQGNDSASFFRYKGQIYHLGEFMRLDSNTELKGWDGYFNDTYFSGVLVKYVNEGEQIVVAQYFS
jgi:hypothetical protein